MSIRTAPGDYLAADTDTGTDASLTAGDITIGNDTFSVIDRHSSFDGTFHSDRDLSLIHI